jgi:hypothetical protein
MAKKFLTNINLSGNQLLNAVIHSASTAPSALAAGQLYFNTGNNLFYYSTGTGTGNWEPVGVQYITSVGSNLSVTGGELDVDLSAYTPTSGLNAIITGYNYITSGGQYIQSVGTNLSVDGSELKVSSDPTFNTVTANQDGMGENFLVGNDAWIGDVNISNTMNVKGVEDATTGYISFGNSNTSSSIKFRIGTDSNDLILASNNDIILNATNGHAYIGTKQMDGSNRIATISDINADNYVKSVSGNLSVDGDGNLTINESGLAGDLVSSSNYLTNSGSTINLNLSSLESQLTSNGFASQSDITTAISNAAGNYDPAGAASSAQSAAESYADGLASNYDAAGTASSAISALNIGQNGSGDVVSTDGTQDLSNKTLDGVTVKGNAYFQSGGGAGGSNNYISVDNSTGTLTINSGYPLTLAAAADINLDPSTGYNVKINGVNVATINDVHAATIGLSVKDSVRVATNSSITISSANTIIDGVTLADLDRILVKNQGTASENGIYTYSISTGLLVRAEDQESPKEGDFVFVEEGSNANTGWIVQSDSTWAQFSASGEYTFNGGLQLSGTTVSVDYSSLESQLVSDDFAKNADYSTVTRKYANSITGNSTDSTFSFTHGLNSRDVMVRVYQTSTGADQYADIEVDIKRTSANAVSITFASAPATGETYGVVIIG